jgi:hypothetical protein
MNKSLQGHFREVIHNNYTLYYFVYMYTQICDENALIWGFPRRMSTWNFDDVNKGNNKITELRTILQRESQNS